MRDDVAAYHANRMHVGESIGVVAALPGSFVHEGADRIVRQHQAPELLTYQLGRFAAQHNPRAAQVGLQLVERRFDLPALVIQGPPVLGPERLRHPVRWSAAGTAVRRRPRRTVDIRSPAHTRRGVGGAGLAARDRSDSDRSRRPTASPAADADSS